MRFIYGCVRLYSRPLSSAAALEFYYHPFANLEKC
jgi:hypothetical protein